MIRGNIFRSGKASNERDHFCGRRLGGRRLRSCGTGSDAVERDYETSLRWYERARRQGIEIPKPFTYPGVRR